MTARPTIAERFARIDALLDEQRRHLDASARSLDRLDRSTAAMLADTRAVLTRWGI